MDAAIEKIVAEVMNSMMEFVMNKNPNANKSTMYNKFCELKIFAAKQKSRNSKKNVRKLLDCLEDKRPVIHVKKSAHENYVLHPPQFSDQFSELRDHKFVINLATQTVTGVENADGCLEPLNKHLIEICHKYKLRFDIPQNLDSEINNCMMLEPLTTLQELGLVCKNEEEEDVDDE